MPGIKFPSAAERENILKELLDAEKNGTALTNGQHFAQYSAAIKELNGLMEEYSKPEEPYGLPKALDAAGKKKMQEAIAKTAAFGETFLADVQKNHPRTDLNQGVPGIVTKIQQMLSSDFEMLSAYDPKQAKLSFLELQENARTQIVDFRGKKIAGFSGSQSSRIPMTVVDAAGNRRRGVFTKATHVDIKGRFDRMLAKQAAYYDSAGFRKQLPAWKEKLYSSRQWPGFIKSADDITDERVIDEMKNSVNNVLSGFRFYLKWKGIAIGGVSAEDASDEMVLGKMADMIDEGASPEAVLKASGVDAKNTSPKVLEGLKKGLQEYSEDISTTLNGAVLKLKDGDRIDQRNSAMSAVASLLGVPNLVVRSSNMKCLDENGNVVEGTFTDYASGMDLFGKTGAKHLTNICDKPFGPPSGIISSLADLQVLDYICGNIDRHGGNMTFHVDENGVFTGVQGIDNDSSFGLCRPGKNGQANRLGGTDSLQVMTASMAEKVKNLTPDMLRFALRGRGLSGEAIQAACDRLADLKQAVAEKSKEGRNISDVKSAGNRICVMKNEDMNRLPINALNKNPAGVFADVKARYEIRAVQGRGSYPYRPGARKAVPDELTEVGTTDRQYTAGGIADSMQSMSRAIKNEVTGFQVSDLSQFMRSSGKFRDMLSAVKDAKTVAGKIKKAVGKGKELLNREDPEVAEQIQKANQAMAKVRTATEAYLQKKMTERHVDSYEALRTAGKNPYEQKRIDYALGLIDSVKTYEKINDPNADKQEKQIASARANMAKNRKAQEAAKNGPAAQA